MKKTEKGAGQARESVQRSLPEGGGSVIFERPKKRACVVCGEKTQHPYHQACGDTWCSVSAALEPRYTDPKRARNDQPKFNDPRLKENLKGVARAHRDRRVLEDKARRLAPLIPWENSLEKAELALVAFDFDETSWFVDNEWIGKDRRGEADPRQSSAWSRTSRLSCAFRAIGGRPAVRIRKRKNRSSEASLIKELMGGSGTYAQAYDVFFAWRCGCQHNLEVVYEYISDIPNEVGYHDACPVCGQAPLEVLPPRRDLKQQNLF